MRLRIETARRWLYRIIPDNARSRDDPPGAKHSGNAHYRTHAQARDSDRPAAGSIAAAGAHMPHRSGAVDRRYCFVAPHVGSASPRPEMAGNQSVGVARLRERNCVVCILAGHQAQQSPSRILSQGWIVVHGSHLLRGGTRDALGTSGDGAAFSTDQLDWSSSSPVRRGAAGRSASDARRGACQRVDEPGDDDDHARTRDVDNGRAQVGHPDALSRFSACGHCMCIGRDITRDENTSAPGRSARRYIGYSSFRR